MIADSSHMQSARTARRTSAVVRDVGRGPRDPSCLGREHRRASATSAMEEVTAWLTQHRLQSYAEVFESVGYDDLDEIKTAPAVKIENIISACKMKQAHANKFRDALKSEEPGPEAAPAAATAAPAPGQPAFAVVHQGEALNAFQITLSKEVNKVAGGKLVYGNLHTTYLDGRTQKPTVLVNLAEHTAPDADLSRFRVYCCLVCNVPWTKYTRVENVVDHLARKGHHNSYREVVLGLPASQEMWDMYAAGNKKSSRFLQSSQNAKRKEAAASKAEVKAELAQVKPLHGFERVTRVPPSLARRLP